MKKYLSMKTISQKIIKEAVDKAIQSFIAKKTQQTLVEYRKLNTVENGRSLFPSNSYNMYIGGDEHDPAHVHIQIPSSRIEATFKIDNGALNKIKHGDRDSKEIREMERKFPQWLKLQSVADPSYTNQDILKMAWIEATKDNLKYQQQNPNNDSLRYQKEIQLRQQQQNQAELSKMQPRKRSHQIRKQS